LKSVQLIDGSGKIVNATATTTKEHNISQTNLIAIGIIVLILLIPEIKRAKIGSIELETSHEPLPPHGKLAPL